MKYTILAVGGTRGVKYAMSINNIIILGNVVATIEQAQYIVIKQGRAEIIRMQWTDIITVGATTTFNTIDDVFTALKTLIGTIQPGGSLSALADVQFTTLTDQQVLTYDAASGKWINQNAPAGSGGGGTPVVVVSKTVTGDSRTYTFTDTVPVGVILTSIWVSGSDLQGQGDTIGITNTSISGTTLSFDLYNSNGGSFSPISDNVTITYTYSLSSPILTASAGGDLTGNYPNPTIKPNVALAGTPTIPSPSYSDGEDSTKIATTHFVKTAVNTAIAAVPVPKAIGTVAIDTTGSGEGNIAFEVPNGSTRCFITARNTSSPGVPFNNDVGGNPGTWVLTYEITVSSFTNLTIWVAFVGPSGPTPTVDNWTFDYIVF